MKIKNEFQKEKYVLIDFDWESSAFWNKDGLNIPLEFFNWNSKSKYVKKGLETLRHVFNSRPVGHNKNEIKESYFADIYIDETLLKLAIEFKKCFPEWTVQIINSFDIENSSNILLTIDNTINEVSLINNLRTKYFYNFDMTNIIITY